MYYTIMLRWFFIFVVIFDCYVSRLYCVGCLCIHCVAYGWLVYTYFCMLCVVFALCWIVVVLVLVVLRILFVLHLSYFIRMNNVKYSNIVHQYIQIHVFFLILGCYHMLMIWVFQFCAWIFGIEWIFSLKMVYYTNYGCFW